MKSFNLYFYLLHWLHCGESVCFGKWIRTGQTGNQKTSSKSVRAVRHESGLGNWGGPEYGESLWTWERFEVRFDRMCRWGMWGSGRNGAWLPATPTHRTPFEPLVPVSKLEETLHRVTASPLPGPHRQSYLEFQLRPVSHPCLGSEFQTWPVSQGPLRFSPGLSCFIDCLFTSIYDL